MTDKLEILICSDVDYNELIAEIYHEGKYVALISQEEGPQKLCVEFPKPDLNEDMVTRKVQLKWFEKALQKARVELIGDTG